MKTILRENVAMLAVSFACFSAEPAVVFAQGGDYNPIPFTGMLSLSRGSVLPQSGGGTYLTTTDACRVATAEWGWDSCETLDSIVLGHVNGVDTTIFYKPNLEGRVDLSDWAESDRDTAISEIEAALALSLKEQGEKLGVKVEMKGWRVYPTLDQEHKVMYYASNIVWDGVPQVNAHAVIFDRRGFVEVEFIPAFEGISEAAIKTMTEAVVQTYSPALNEGYAAFMPGDKIAAVGAVGVLASILGVKYGQGALAGLLAVALLVLKKAWFVLLLPVYAFRRLFRRGPPGGDGPAGA